MEQVKIFSGHGSPWVAEDEVNSWLRTIPDVEITRVLTDPPTTGTSQIITIFYKTN